MTNQTVIFSMPGVAPGSHRTLVMAEVDNFVRTNMNSYSNFCIQPVVATVGAGGNVWYTVQVNYYDAAVQEQ